MSSETPTNPDNAKPSDPVEAALARIENRLDRLIESLVLHLDGQRINTGEIEAIKRWQTAHDEALAQITNGGSHG